MGNIFTKPLFGTKPREPLTDPVEIERARLTVRDSLEPIVAVNAGVVGGMSLAAACSMGGFLWPSGMSGLLSWDALKAVSLLVALPGAAIAYFWWGFPFLARHGESISVVFVKRRPTYAAFQLRQTHTVMRRVAILAMLAVASVPLAIGITMGGFADALMLVLPAVGGGLLALGLRSRRGMDPRCRNCGYPNALPPDPSTCTECGRDLTTHDGLMLGLPVRDPRLIVPGAVMLIAGCIWIALI